MIARITASSLALALAAAVCGPSAASGAILFTQGGATGTGPGGSGATTFTSADNFSLGQDATVEKITWLGIYAGLGMDPAPSDSFTVRIYDDSNGLPGSPVRNLSGLAITRVDTGGAAAQSPVFSYSIDLGLAGFQALAGVTYWLAIQNTDGSAAVDWFWRDGDTTGTYALGDVTGSTWLPDPNTPAQPLGLQPGNRAFTLEGTFGSAVVPEPGTLALVGAGALAVLGARRRRR